MLRDQKNSEMFLFVRLLRRLRCSVLTLRPLPTKPNGCSLQKSHLYKENVIKKKFCILLRLLSISYTADIGIMRFFFVITWWALDS